VPQQLDAGSAEQGHQIIEDFDAGHGDRADPALAPALQHGAGVGRGPDAAITLGILDLRAACPEPFRQFLTTADTADDQDLPGRGFGKLRQFKQARRTGGTARCNHPGQTPAQQLSPAALADGRNAATGGPVGMARREQGRACSTALGLMNTTRSNSGKRATRSARLARSSGAPISMHGNSTGMPPAASTRAASEAAWPAGRVISTPTPARGALT
jgi:hypothetical protein